MAPASSPAAGMEEDGGQMKRGRAASGTGAGENKKGKKGDRGQQPKDKKGSNQKAKHKVTQQQALEALPILAKATCSSLQAVRELEGTLNDTVLFPTDHQIPKAMKAATKAWSERVEKDGRGHKHGPPHLSAWEAFVGTLVKEDVGGAAKAELQKLIEQFANLNQQERLLEVRVCKVKTAYDQANSKVTLSVRGKLEEARKMLLEAARQAGGELKSGKAPPGGLERQPQKFLTTWTLEEEE